MIIVEFISFYNNKILNKIYLKIFIIFFIFFAGLRVGVGNDWYSYLEFYNNLNLTNQLMEFGFIFINNTLSENNVPFALFLIIINAISLFFAYKFIKENCKVQFLALLIYVSDSYFHFNLSGVRQAMALGLCCYAIKYAISRNLGIYFTLICLAATFHITALIVLVNYFVPRGSKFINLKNFVVMSFFVMLLLIILIEFHDLVFNFFSLFVSVEFKNKLFLKINVYASSIHGIDINFIKGIIRRSIPILLLYLYWPVVERIGNLRYFINIYLIGFLLYLTTYAVSPDIATRFSIYFLIFECLIISNLAYSCINIISKFYLIVIYSLIIGYKFVDIIQRPAYDYHFIW